MDTKVFNLAQSFFIDADSVKGAKSVGISSIELFFKSKPTAEGNKSGISNPGVYAFICDITPNKNPDITPYLRGATPIARVPYQDIDTSSDASRPTKFKFKSPVFVESGKEYAFVVIYEGNESFDLWKSKQGDLLIGTNKVSPGPSGKYDGNYYGTYYHNTVTGVEATMNPPPWKPLSDTDLKFSVNIARYAINGVLIDNILDTSGLGANVEIYGTLSTQSSGVVNTSYSGTTLTYNISSVPHEFVVFDKKNSKNAGLRAGEYLYQNTIFYPGGTASPATINISQGSDLITANTLLPNGSSFDWNSIYTEGPQPEYIVIVGLDSPTAGKRTTDIRRIISVESNTVLRVDSNVSFTNSAAYFMKTAVAKLSYMDTTKHFDHGASTVLDRKKRVKQDLLVMTHSNANGSVRFANDTINSISISANGVNYKSSDYVVVYGYEDNAKVSGGYPAIANISVNGTGNLTGIYLTNVGAGFSNSANLKYVFANGLSGTPPSGPSTANTANGSGATFTATTGTVIRSLTSGEDQLGGYFSGVKIINREFTDIIPAISSTRPAGTEAFHYYKNPYYIVNSPNDTYIGSAYFVASNINSNRKLVHELTSNRMNFKNISVVPSRSNEFVIIDDVTNTTRAEVDVVPGSGVIEMQTVSNNDFVPTLPHDFSILYGKYAINNDYSGENTDYGNAEAKHITSKINFASDRFAEDLIVYLTAYRPLNTDIKVFARIHNGNDPEAFDDKDWTLLNLDSSNVYSSSSDSNDYIEMQFGFPDSPNTAVTIAGTVNVDSISTTNVIGTGTLFSSNATANLQINDLVKIYPPSFPSNYAICVVSSVDSDTQFKITDPINNADITGSGLRLELLGRIKSSSFAGIGYPMQAFNNKNNFNVSRYFNSSMTPFDTYGTVQIKLVMLADMSQVDSNSANAIPTVVPRIDDIRVVGVTV
jgi:hypothetical protein